MPLSLDPEIATALKKMMGDAPPPKLPPPGNVADRRAMFDSWMGLVSSMLPKVTDVTAHDFATKSADSTPVKLRWYEKKGGTKGSAVLYLHGGGMILGSVDTYDTVVRTYVSQSSVPILSVDYRLAPESPHPMPVEARRPLWQRRRAAHCGASTSHRFERPPARVHRSRTVGHLLQ